MRCWNKGVGIQCVVCNCDFFAANGRKGYFGITNLKDRA
jgi:hypothetical protein